MFNLISTRKQIVLKITIYNRKNNINVTEKKPWWTNSKVPPKKDYYYIRIRYNDTNYNPLSLQNNTLMFDLIYSIGVQLYKYININARTTLVELV